MSVRVLIMSGYGINCERESKQAWELAGAAAKIVHINDLISGTEQMADYDIIMFPGGFSYGDDTGSGNAFAKRLRNNLWKEITSFIEEGKLMLGVCNGFQIMTSLGLFTLPGAPVGEQQSALLANTHDRYECRWINVKATTSKCVFTKGIDQLALPIAHGEGRFFCEEATLEELKKGQVVFTYTDASGKPAGGRFPENPNGALADIAAICDPTGKLLGMMPHPERALYTINAPDFHARQERARRTGEELPERNEKVLRLFTNAITYSKERQEEKKEAREET